MNSYYFLFEISLILFTTKLLGLLSRRIKLPQVVGALLAGIIIGPCVLNIVVENEFITQLSEIGVIFLMFIAGLETDIDALKKQGKASFVIALLGVLIPFVLGLGTTYLFGKLGMEEIMGNSNLFLESVFVGVILTATSVSITVETLREMGKLNSSVGNALLGAAIIDDILGIIALSVVSSFADTSVKISVILLKIVLYFVFMAVVSFILYKVLKTWFTDSENFKRHVIAVIGLCLLLAYISEEYFGVADITGAFITGLIISAVGLKKEKIMFAVDDLSYAFLSPIFFASIGLKLVLPDMSMMIVVYAIVLSIIAIISKICGCALGAKMFKFSNRESLQIGAGMVSRGEVALIVANKGMKLGILSNVIFAPILIVVIVTTIVAPILLKIAFGENKTKINQKRRLAN
ncbi:cation:proton antiporter [Intestinibacter bartlettii]|uniref:Cation:proton antiporter n=1 Tax=Intestinibacter bartlettii TaxID=261299 RepID=A0ABS6DYA7_9FIRM|nr:cation:proton antiporter [Intestinibacter bartlettii]MBU5336833.1 cation:proton antiporter [Intestinibacter bartlettii]